MSAPRFLFVLPLLVSASLAQDNRSQKTIINPIVDGFATLNRMYWSPGIGIWLDRPGDDLRAHYEGRRNPPWWTSANAIETQLDFMKASGRNDYEKAIAELYELHRAPGRKDARMIAELKRRNQWSEADEEKYQRRVHEREERAKAEQTAPSSAHRKRYYVDFCNEYLDDSGWWGIAWLKMYDRTRDAKYLATAKTIQAHMAANWRPDKGGGVLWCEDPDKLRANAITTSLFVVLSARLYERTKEKPFLDWATKGIDWERAQKLYDGIGVIDAPGHKGDYWSYNQGVYIGGLTALYQATGDLSYLDEAATVAKTVMADSGMVSAELVIVEKLGTQGWDGGMFKGIMARYFGQLGEVLHATQRHPDIAAKLDAVLRNTAASLLQHSLMPDGQFTAEWHENARNRECTFNTQVSALAELVAVLQGLNR